jgi:hypothetical protein
MNTLNVIEKNKWKVIKVVQELLIDIDEEIEITPLIIDEMIDRVLLLNKDWGVDLDRGYVIEELVRRFSVWIGHDTSLVNNIGHEPWLTAERKNNWRYWQRYREWQEQSLPWKAVEAQDVTTDSILGLLEDPKRSGSWDRRGLVVGHVQSGKTGNYTGLICKAADAGYKIIIVLAGMHKNLRSQTQMRLDEGFLGYETNPVAEDIRLIGVGKIDKDPLIRPHYATHQADNGDFNRRIAKNLGISPEERPCLFVVKKNKSVLNGLYQWLLNHVSNTQDPETARKIITHLPLLIIDDEADNASVDTGEQLFGEDGNPDPEHQPTAINLLIRKILHTFSRSAYVGYTATPFANIFIHERGETLEAGPDLFPAAFIINLGAPSTYIGPSKVFGLPNGENRNGLPLVRTVDDYCNENTKLGWMPIGHKNGHKPTYDNEHNIPPSLIQAVNAFILACAARRIRHQGEKHCSMLIHVTRFTSVQKEVYEQVQNYILHVRQRLLRSISEEVILDQLKNLWITDFVPTSIATAKFQKYFCQTGENENWEQIKSVLCDVITDIQVKMINGTAKDILDYKASPTGLKVIAIGGDKLARGLTLEGLCVSYFLRASRMYDTLMQMGRWFGYRPGYIDLCRLYTSGDLIEWFGHIAEASEELREEFDLMTASGGTPKDYGLKVRSHSVLMVTSKMKMRTAHNLYLSFSGQVVETVSLFRDKENLTKNLLAFNNLVKTLGTSEPIPEQQRNGRVDRWTGGASWQGVPAEKVISFLENYKTHPEALKVNSILLAEFIRKMSNAGELTHWMIVVTGGSSENRIKAGGIDVKLMKRSGNPKLTDRYSIGRLLQSQDESIDLNETAWNAALKLTQEIWHADPGRLKNGEESKTPTMPNGPSIRRIRGFGSHGVQAHPERGLLIISLLDLSMAGLDITIDLPPAVGFAISFPGSNSGNKVEYKVNNTLWEQEYGPAE